MAGRFTVESVFKAVDRISAPVSRMQQRIQKMTRSMRRGFRAVERSVDKVARGLKRAGTAITAAAAITAVALKGLINTGADFEQSIVSAAIKFPGAVRRGTEAFKALEDAAKKTGATTEFTATQTAQALNFLALAGFNAETAIAALPGVVDLATSAELDLAAATDIASDALGAFGLMSKDASTLGLNLARVNDVIAKTATSANTNVEQFFEAMKDGAPVATAAGASIETFAALVGKLADSGIKGSKAGTALKRVFLSLSAPTSGATKQLRKLGISTTDSSGDLLDVVDILGQLEKSLDGLGNVERSKVLDDIFGKIPIAAVNVLLATGSEELRTFRDRLLGAKGASKEMATQLRSTTRGSINALISAVEGVTIAIFDLNRGPLKGVIDSTTDWVRANKELIATNVGEFLAKVVNNFDEIIKTGKQIAGLVALFIALSAAIKVVTVVTMALNIVLGTITATTVAWAAFSKLILGLPAAIALVKVAMVALNLVFAVSPIGLLVAGIAALVGLAAAVIIHWEPVKAFFNDLGKSIGSVVDSISSVGSVFGFGDEGGEEERQRFPVTQPQLIRPEDRTQRAITEILTGAQSELTIRDETGRAELTKSPKGNGLKLLPSGGF